MSNKCTDGQYGLIPNDMPESFDVEHYSGKWIRIKGTEDNTYNSPLNNDCPHQLSKVVTNLKQLLLDVKNKEASRDLLETDVINIKKELITYIVYLEEALQEFANHIRLLGRLTVDYDTGNEAIDELIAYRLLERLDNIYEEIAPFVIRKHVEL